MSRIIGNIIGWLIGTIIVLPARLLALLAFIGFGIVLWFHRKRHNRLGLTGSEAAAAIIDGRNMKTKLAAFEIPLADCYLPWEETIVLSERTYNGTSIGAVSIAAHEAGHAIQRKRWFVPWLGRQLLVWPAGMGVTLCLWVWGLGMLLQNQVLLLAAAGCFVIYLLFLLIDLVCERDASRRALAELTRREILDPAEARMARRILRSALVTYIGFFLGSLIGLAFFLASLDWPFLIDQLPPDLAEHFHSIWSSN